MRDHCVERLKHSKAIIDARKRTVRKQKMTLCISAFLITLVLTASVGVRFTFAKSTYDGPKRIKVYKSVLIYSGDTLNSIASEHCSEEFKDRSSYIHEVSMINHLNDDDMLIAGNYLIIPYYIEASAGDF